MRQVDMRFGKVRFQAYGFSKFGDPVVIFIRQFTDQSHTVMSKYELWVGFQYFLKLCKGFVVVSELHQSQTQFVAGLQGLWRASRGRLELGEGRPEIPLLAQ